MKTEIIMQRDLNGVKIRQNHKTGFFCANDLLDLYNSGPGVKKEVWGYLRSKAFKEYREIVLADILNTAKMQSIENNEDLTIETKRGKYGGFWFHPYIFMDFAMWLSPEFKLVCVKWIYDKLIQVRDQAGESFKEVNQALFDLKPSRGRFEYSNEAKMINKLVFGSPESGQRNLATEKSLELLKALQYADKKLICDGMDYFQRYEKLKEYKNNYLIMNP